MPFVQQSGCKNKRDGPEFRLDRIELLMLEASICQGRQNEMFRDVAAFPNDQMPEIDLLRR